MRYFIFTIFLVLTTFSMSLGDVFAIILSISGFMFMMYMCEGYEEAEYKSSDKNV